MKLVMIVSRVPYPLEKGDKLRAYHQLRLLALKHELHLICLSDKNTKPEHLEHLRHLVKSLHVFQLNKMSIAFSLFRGLFSNKPFQVHYFYNASVARRINKLIDEIHPDHIYCQLIRTAEYVKNRHDFAKTIDYMDALNAGMRRRLERTWGIKKWLIQEESNRLVRYENLIFDYFEHHTIISQQDKELIYHKDRSKIHVVPNGVDTAFFTPNKEVKKEYDIVFTGNMNYPPNIDGAIRLVREIKPLVEGKMRPVSILIAGADPSNEVLLLDKIKGVKVTGWVEDIRDAYNAALVFVAPMRIGSGMQNKILEAMSMTLPCITTTIAANAFNSEQKKKLFIADSNQDIASHIIELLNRNDISQKSGEEARTLVLSNFNWSASVEQLELIFKS